MGEHPMSKSSPLKRAIVAPAVGALMAGLFSLGTAAPASALTSAPVAGSVGAKAHPTGCSYGISHRSGSWASCSSHNGGSYRAITICQEERGTRKKNVSATTWKQSGMSYSYCGAGWVPDSAGIESSASNKS